MRLAKKTNGLYLAEKTSPYIPNLDGTPSEHRFGDDVEIWIPIKSKIAGYTYEHGELVLIAMYQGGAYTIRQTATPPVTKSEDKW